MYLDTPQNWREPLRSWLTSLRAAGKPETTIYLRGYQLRRFAAETGLDPWTATLDDLTEWQAGHGWGPETLRSFRAALRGFYNWAHLTGRISVNPALLLPSVIPPAGQPRPASEDMLRAALATAHPRERLMVEMAARAGLRRGEIARSRREDVERDIDGWWLRVLGKGSKTRRVPLSPALAAEIRRMPDGWLFPGQINGHLSPPRVGELVSALLPETWTAHSLRHRFASKAYAGERDLRAVQELLGHAKVSTTQRYTLVPDGALRAAVNAAA